MPPKTLADYITDGTLPPEDAVTLERAITSGKSILIGGEFQSGRTTLLHALARLTDPTQQYVLVDDRQDGPMGWERKLVGIRDAVKERRPFIAVVYASGVDDVRGTLANMLAVAPIGASESACRQYVNRHAHIAVHIGITPTPGGLKPRIRVDETPANTSAAKQAA